MFLSGFIGRSLIHPDLLSELLLEAVDVVKQPLELIISPDEGCLANALASSAGFVQRKAVTPLVVVAFVNKPTIRKVVNCALGTCLSDGLG